jgi:Icc protein
MDEIALDNPAALFAIIDRYPQVRAVLWGHIHQEFSAERGGVHLFGSPSTCVQFKPGAQEYVPDTQPPGYRWLLLQGDGTVQTGIQRVKGAA